MMNKGQDPPEVAEYVADVRSVKKAIRNIHSARPVPPRIFDVCVQNGVALLEIKTGKHMEIVPWADVVAQVEEAIQSNIAV